MFGSDDRARGGKPGAEAKGGAGPGAARKDAERTTAKQPEAGASGAGAGARGESAAASPGTPQSLLPAVSLPKGGGAVRGIGEKFSVNSATGTASLSVPLPASPGRGGAGPDVALSYSSGAGNGPFGIGFQLSAPTISRKTDKGIPRYVDDAESDTFVLSGAEDLVPVLDEDGQHVFVERGEHRAYRYRPRIEGLFARIERWRHTQSRDVHWRVTTKDNVTHTYGTGNGTRLYDPEHPSYVFTWLLETTSDDKGNLTRYEYKAEDGIGVDATRLCERSRFDYSAATPIFLATAQKYLKRVLYGNAAPNVDGDYLFELVFDYGDHAATTPTSVPAPAASLDWPVREDPFSTYRSGFELRTYRLCRRVLMFHRLNAARSALFVRSTELIYEASPVVTYLTGVTQVGHSFDATSSTWTHQRMPTLALDYQRAELNDELQVLPERSLDGLAGGTDGARKQWVDLDGEGIPGVLIDQGGSWFYKENLGGGVLSAPRQLASQPRPGAMAGGVQKLEDIDGDGRLELVAYEQRLSGYFERSESGSFDPLRQFESLPHLDWNDPNLRFIDLDGDGHADLLLTEDNALVFYRSRAKLGFEPSQRQPVPFDENQGPHVVFDDPEQTIQLADMSGDGLVDIVRVRNGEISYWPNLGYGRFGKKITLENCPVFTNPEEFRAARVRFGDVDGSGTSDLFYASRTGTTLYLNQSGNRLADGIPIRSLPPVDSAAQLSVADLLGNGTSCLVWTSPLQHPSNTVLFVDLLNSIKPHLLKTVSNHLGATTTLTYASSTKFYLEDKLAGIAWLTRLPFPVQVVERIEREDAISGGKLVTTYRYRHGFYDGFEREFRGFARVEQRDAEEFPADGTDPLLYQPPVRIVSWHHTGAWLEKERLELALQSEYFQNGPPPLLVDDTLLPENLSVQDAREAARALKGTPLRQEIYADDNTPLAPLPYSITEQNQQVRLLQKSRAEDRYGVCFAFPRETVSISSERRVDDPRVGHELILDVDDFGNVTRKLSLAYARAATQPGSLPDQQVAYATLSEADFVNQPDQLDLYRIGTAVEKRTYEITGLDTDLPLPTAGAGLANLDAIVAALAPLTPATDLPFEASPTPGTLQRRLIDRLQQTFYSETGGGLGTEAPLGTVGPHALPYQTYQLALTTGQIARIVADSQDLSGTPFDPSLLLTEGKYVQRDSNYWTQSGRVVFDVANFYLPIEAIDPFDAHSFVTYDNFSLLITSARDPLDNLVTAVNDYRVLAPAELTDPNLNRSAVAFDALGMVIATAVMGKANRNEGDTPDNPTTWLTYDLLAFEDRGEPAFVHTFAREKHFSVDPTARIQQTLTYSDGFGRVVLTKVQAEPARGTTTPRWVGTGRTLFNNKGNPVKQYEPYFSANSDFETEDAIVATGVTPILRYDSLDRLIRTDLPDGTFTKVEFDSWQQANWDQNDTVLQSQWYIDRGSPPPTGPEPSTPAQRAAWLAAQHANTPAISHLDTLGRPFLSDAHNRTDGLDDHYFTKTKLDIEGNTIAIFDARQIKANAPDPLATIEQTFDVLQRRLKVVSADAGTRLMVPDVAGKPLRTWDSRGQTQRQRFDALQRPTHAYVRKGATERLLLRTVYGEALDAPGPPPTDPNFASPAQQANLRGKAHHVYDCAGLVTSIEHDFKGNLLSASRRLAVAYQTEPDWRPGEDLALADDILTAILAATPPLLQSETFTTESTFDALNRVTSASAPDAVAPELRSVTRPEYNEANLLDAVFVSIRGATETPVITDLDYNARGQRVFCANANGTTTTYQYDPKTFRLTELITLKGGIKLQHLLYSYDPVGNITDIQDLSNWDAVLSALTASGVTGSGKYRYDALYRLLSATGREHPGPQPNGRPEAEPPRWPIPHGNDLQALQSYREELAYDEVGNILEMRHLRGPSNNASWSRRYDYFLENNRLRATSAPGDAPGTYSDPYGYQTDALNDAGRHGSMTSMPHLATMEWDYADRLKHTLKSNGSAQDTYFTYDASGQRVRKVYHHNGLIEERIYLGGYEVYRRHMSGAITATPEEERQTLHLMDDQRRVAMVETKTRDAGATVANPVSRWRFQLDNHLGSAMLELDESGNVISYEEYHPYGSTAFHTADGNAGVSAKQYRYTGKENDDETGLYYHGARYYAPWLGRWTAADPLVLNDAERENSASYVYASNTPLIASDPDGKQTVFPQPQTPHHLVANERRKTSETADAGRPTAPPPPSESDIAWRNAQIAAATFSETAAADAAYKEATSIEGIDQQALKELYLAEREAILEQAEGLLDYRYAGRKDYERSLLIASSWYALQTARGVEYALTTDQAKPVEELQPEVLEAGVRPPGFRLPRPRTGSKAPTKGEYGRVKGHHIHAQAAFRGHGTYDPKKGFSIGQEYMKQRGWDHGAMTAKQRELFDKLAASGRPNSLTAHGTIARKALMAGGATRAEAAALVRESLVNLRAQLVRAPTRIPWN